MTKTLHKTTVLAGMTLLIVASSAHAEPPFTRPQFTVQPAAVARTVVTALAIRGIQVSTDQVRLSMDVPATEESPLLEVSSVEKLGRLSGSQPGQTSASIRLKCSVTTSCRPFFAIATWQEDTQAKTAAAEAAKTGAATATIAKPSADQLTLKAQLPVTLIKAGQPLRLLMEGDHMHIQITVVSLGSASAGQMIRVSTPDHKNVYMAEVLDAATVKGTL